MSPTDELFLAPKHPYTAALLSAVPVADPRIRSKMQPLEGDVPSPANPPSGCHFHPRCPFATDLCRQQAPDLEEVQPNHFVACHRGKPSYHCLASQSQPDPSRNMLFSADQKVNVDGQGTLTESLQTVDSTVQSEKDGPLGCAISSSMALLALIFNPYLNPEDFHRSMQALLRTGVTNVLPTLITADKDDLYRNFEALERARAISPIAKMMVRGYHLEGPFLNPAQVCRLSSFSVHGKAILGKVCELASCSRKSNQAADCGS